MRTLQAKLLRASKLPSCLDLSKELVDLLGEGTVDGSYEYSTIHFPSSPFESPLHADLSFFLEGNTLGRPSDDKLRIIV